MSQTVKSKLQCVYTRVQSMQRWLHLHTCPYLGIFLWFLSGNMCILTTELRSGHMVEESCCLADLEKWGGERNHPNWWNTEQGSVVIGNLIQMLLGNEPRCGRKWESTRTIKRILLFNQSLPEKNREIPHLFTFVFMSVQFRVHRGRPAPRGAGQAGEDALLRAVHDGGGTDAGVVPTQEAWRERVMHRNACISVFKRRSDYQLVLFLRFCPRTTQSQPSVKWKSNSEIEIIPHLTFEITSKVTGHRFHTRTHSREILKTNFPLCLLFSHKVKTEEWLSVLSGLLKRHVWSIVCAEGLTWVNNSVLHLYPQYCVKTFCVSMWWLNDTRCGVFVFFLTK